MQSEKQPPTSPQNKGTLKKWLPAIALALVIHGLLLFVFFNSQKSTDSGDSEVTTHSTEAATSSEDLEHEKEVLLTLIEERTLTKTEQESAEKNAEDADTDESKKDESTKSENDAKTEEEVEKKENEKSDSGSSKDKKESVKNVTQNEGQKQQNTSPPLDSSTYTPQPAINPNDAVLLPRDLPQVEQNPIIGNNNYANTAQQSEDFSDQLSSAVNEIKEQKLREIEAQQQASKAAYLKNQPAPAKPKTNETTTDSVE